MDSRFPKIHHYKCSNSSHGADKTKCTQNFQCSFVLFLFSIKIIFSVAKVLNVQSAAQNTDEIDTITNSDFERAAENIFWSFFINKISIFLPYVLFRYQTPWGRIIFNGSKVVQNNQNKNHDNFQLFDKVMNYFIWQFKH